MKKTLVLIGSIFLVLLLAALPIQKVCAESVPTPEKPITLKMATFFAPKDIRQIYTEKWGNAITKATNGAIRFKYYPAQQLVKAKEMSDSLQSGLIDANTWFNPNYTPEDYPFLSAIFLIPFGMPLDLKTRQAFAKDKEVQELLFAPLERHNIKRCWGMLASYGQEWYFNEPWDPKDLAKNFYGKKIRGPAITAVKILLNYLGATQVSMSAPEIYEAGQRGLIQGATQGFSQYTSAHVYEIFPYVMDGHSTFTLPTIGTPCVMRLNLFNSFPPDIQKKIMDVSQDSEDQFFYAYKNKVDFLREDLIKKGKVKQYVRMDPETKAKWKRGVDPLIDKAFGKEFPNRWPKLKALLDKYSKF